MRREFSLLARFVVPAAFAVVVGLIARGVALSQDEAAATAAVPDAAPATEGATDAVPGAEGAAGEEAKETAEQVLEKGKKALIDKDFPAAYSAFDRLARVGEQDLSFSPQAMQLRLIGYTGRGQALAGMKEYDAAVEEFKQAIDLEPNFIAALLARGQMYLDLGIAENYGAALNDFKNAVKLQRGNPVALFGFGKSLILTNNYQAGIIPLTKIIDALSQALSQPSENAESLRVQLAEAYRLRGTGYAGVFKIREAVDDLNKSLTLNPNDYETYLNLAGVAFRAENYQETVDQLQKAIENYKPKDPEDKLPYFQGHLTRASAYMEMGKKAKTEADREQAYEAARLEAEKVLAPLDPKNPYHGGIRATALYTRGVAERMAGELDQAVQTFSEAIELNPELGEAYYRRGICYHYLGEDRLAIADFTEASNINFGDPRAALWLGFTYAKMGQYLDALRAYSDALAASDRYTPAYINRGLAYMALGEHDKALADFNDAVRLEPTNADYYFKRGLAYEALGQTQKAAESFGSAIEFNDKHAAAYRHLADAMQQLGRTDLATQYRQRATELATPTAKKAG